LLRGCGVNEPRNRLDEAGFSLVEVLVATSLVAGALVSLAQLFVLAVMANDSARRTSEASVFAEQKIEQLRSSPWIDSDDRVEYLDERGNVIPTGSSTSGALYIRRWRIAAVPGRIGTVAVHVTVHAASVHDPGDSVERRPAMARMLAIRVRNPP
jgi:Tfp pilus assembly protein PilV